MSDTPETVEAVRAALLEGNYTVPLIMVDACKKLERERDEAQNQRDLLERAMDDVRASQSNDRDQESPDLLAALERLAEKWEVDSNAADMGTASRQHLWECADQLRAVASRFQSNA